MTALVAQFLAGLAGASSLFLVAAGLTLIFGVTRVVNFAHGSFYMLGAYIAYSLTAWLSGQVGALGFWLAIPLSALIVGALGLIMEVSVLRRLYRSHELFALVATFALVLVIKDVTLAIWGPEDRIGPLAPGLDFSLSWFGLITPAYDLFLIALGPLVWLFLRGLIHKTRWGLQLRAATSDPDMAAALGIDQRRIFTTVVFLGTALAGLAGAVQVPREAITLNMDLGIIAVAFAVVVVGGMGSLGGAFLAALVIAEINAFGLLVLPEATLVLTYLIMAVVLLLRPRGLAGARTHEVFLDAPPPLRPPSRPVYLGVGLLLVFLLASPLLLGRYGLGLASEALILALFAASLQLLIGLGGLVTFGQAALFGIGAYAAGLLVHHLSAPMLLALAAAPCLGLFLGGLSGLAARRLKGVYLAMFTLALAQLLWATAFQWVGFTGGDNGLIGIWPAPWAGSPLAYFYLTLALCLLALAALWRLVFSPFGLTLRAARDAPLRAEASGLDLNRHHMLAFAAAGLFAGLAGGLHAFLKGSVFPDDLGIAVSVDGLVMALFGGIETLTGPLLGGGLLTLLKAELRAQTELWRGVLGLIIIALCVLLPHGLIGTLKRRWNRS